MKKSILFPAMIAAVMLGASAASAQTGDVVGHIYSTDIRAYINDTEVPAYNIGGRTVVIAEDLLTSTEYHDEFRTLLIGDFYPNALSSGSNATDGGSGRIIGDIYETDIKTYMYDKELPAYNLNGKTAVAIEDLGGFKEYNDLGGRYFYDDDTRTLKLDILYSNFPDAMTMLFDNAADVTYSLSGNKTHITAEYAPADKFSVGGNTTETEELIAFLNEQGNGMIPVTAMINGEEKQIGWNFTHGTKDYYKTGYRTPDGGFTDGYGYSFTGEETEVYELLDEKTNFYFIYTDIAKDAAKDLEHPVLTKREEVEKDWWLHHWNKITDKLETDDYTFIYAGFYGLPHGGASENLLRIENDGTYRDYAKEFESVSLYGQKTFDNVTIDKENEKCYFRYDKDYVIDLKTGEMTAKEN